MNDEMVMKRRSGKKSTIIRRMLNVFNLHFTVQQQWKQCLEFALAKLREICKYSAGAYYSNRHARRLHYLTFCLQKQGREINAMRRVLSENVFKGAQRYHSHGMRRSLFAN